MTYTYDTWGNITEKKIYAYTTASNPGTPTSTIPYVYGNSSWKDQLTKYNGQTISYDAMGNPTTYRGKTLTWKGKELTGVTGTASYTYDMNGLRTTKTVSSVTTNYFYNNTVLMGLTSGSNKLLFSYDAKGLVQAVNFNGTYYYYLRNGQGDIVKIIDSGGTAKVEYSYDSWGKKLSCTGTLATTLGKLNPFRYRGYVYDEETQWYYLKSRYYDPETCRFISADVLLSTGQGVLGHNSFAYCENNPANMTDSDGDWPKWVETAAKIVSAAVLVAAVAATVVATAITVGTATPAIMAAAPVVSVVLSASLSGINGGIANEAKGNSYANGYIGGAASGTIQSLASRSLPKVGAVVGGAIGTGTGTMITMELDNLDPYSSNYTQKEILNESLNNAGKAFVTSIPTKIINSGVEIAKEKTGKLMPGMTYGFGEGVKAFFGALDDALVYLWK